MTSRDGRVARAKAHLRYSANPPRASATRRRCQVCQTLFWTLVSSGLLGFDIPPRSLVAERFLAGSARRCSFLPTGWLGERAICTLLLNDARKISVTTDRGAPRRGRWCAEEGRRNRRMGTVLKVPHCPCVRPRPIPPSPPCLAGRHLGPVA